MSEADQQVQAWVQQVLGTDDVPALHLPEPDQQGITLYLLRVTPVPPARSVKRPVLQIRFHYLVMVQQDDLQAAHRQLTDLLFAALAEPTMDVQTDELSESLWLSLGLPPQPAFVMSVTLRRTMPEPDDKPILHPMQTNISHIEPQVQPEDR